MTKELRMRSHSLEHYFGVVYRTIIQHQNPVTGLLPAHQIAGCEVRTEVRAEVTLSANQRALSIVTPDTGDQ